MLRTVEATTSSVSPASEVLGLSLCFAKAKLITAMKMGRTLLFLKSSILCCRASRWDYKNESIYFVSRKSGRYEIYIYYPFWLYTSPKIPPWNYKLGRCAADYHKYLITTFALPGEWAKISFEASCDPRFVVDHPKLADKFEFSQQCATNNRMVTYTVGEKVALTETIPTYQDAEISCLISSLDALCKQSG